MSLSNKYPRRRSLHITLICMSFVMCSSLYGIQGCSRLQKGENKVPCKEFEKCCNKLSQPASACCTKLNQCKICHLNNGAHHVKRSGDYCYFSKDRNWGASDEICQNVSAKMPHIYLIAQNNDIESITGNVWVGARRKNDQSEFRWEDDSSHLSHSYTKWEAGAPDGKFNGDCVSMASYGKWYNRKCTEEIHTICSFQ